MLCNGKAKTSKNYNFKITHFTNTEAGSSGSPIFNDMWEIIAIHKYDTNFNFVIFNFFFSAGAKKDTPKQNFGIKMSHMFNVLKRMTAWRSV